MISLCLFIDGQTGSGKSLSLAHILHYAHNSKFILYHIPYGKIILNIFSINYFLLKNFFFLVPIWLKYDRKEVNWSTTKSGLADIPLIAAQWLKHFKHQNEVLLNELNVSIILKYNGNHNKYNALKAFLHCLKSCTNLCLSFENNI